MADRFPLILNTSANQIQEIASGDTLDLTGNSIKNVGVLTATSLDISGDIDVDGHTNLDNLSVAGVSTFASAIDLNADLDIDGHLNVDNVSIAGVSTFASAIDLNADLDVDGHTNLDNVSIAGVTTIGGQFTVNANNDGANVRFINDTHTAKFYLISEGANKNSQIFFGDAADDDIGSIDYDHANNSLLFVTNTSTRMTIDSGGKVSIGGDLDVDGHTNLDNVSVAGVSTFTGNADFSSGIDVTGTITGTSHIDLPDAAQIKLGDSDEFIIQHTAGGASLISETGSGNLDISATNIQLKDASGNNKLQSNGGGIAVTGNATVSGNLSVAGVMTYEDVTNVDSVGVVTARSGLKVLAGGANVVGVVTATTLTAGGLRITDDGATGPLASIMADDGNPWSLQIGNSTYSTSYSTGHQFFIANNGNAFHEVRSSTSSYNDYNLRLNNSGNTSKNCIKINGSDQSVVLYAGGVNMLQTTSTGATLLGELNATGANFTDDGQSTPIVSVMTDDTNPWGLQVGNSTYSASTIFGWQIYVNNTGEGYQYHIGSGAYKDFHFYQHNQSSAKLMIKFEADDNSVELYNAGNKKLETTGSGVTVTGTLAATAVTGDGSALTNVSVGLSTEQVTPSSNVATLDLTKDDHKIVASGTYTITCTGGTEAENHTLRLENSGTAHGGFSSYFKFPSGGTPSLPTTNGAISLISFTVHKVGSVGIATVLLSGASVNYS